MAEPRINLRPEDEEDWLLNLRAIPPATAAPLSGILFDPTTGEKLNDEDIRALRAFSDAREEKPSWKEVPIEGPLPPPVIERQGLAPSGKPWEPIWSPFSAGMKETFPGDTKAGDLEPPVPSTAPPEALRPVAAAEDVGGKINEALVPDLAAESKAYEDRAGKLRLARTIAENLSQIGQGLGAAAGHLPPQAFPRVNLRGLDEEIMLEEDKLRPGERQFLREGLGIDVPEGISHRHMSSLLPSVAAVKGREAMMGLQRARFNQLPRYISEPVEGLKTGRDIVTDIRNDFQGQTGPVSGRIQKALIRAGMPDTGVAVTNANAIFLLTSYIFTKSGKTVTDEERKLYNQAFPNVAQDESQFQALLDNIDKRLEKEIENKLDIWEKQGHDANEIRQWALGGGRGNVGGNNIRVRDKATGRTGTLPAEEFDETKYERIQ